MKHPILLAGLLSVLLPACGVAAPTSQSELEQAWLAFSNARGAPSLIRGDVNHPSANAVFRAMPSVDPTALDPAKLQLGSTLFNERRLSRDGTVSCASCHIALMGGVDHRPVPFGIGGAEGTLNAPTILNAALNFRQFWDGRAFNLHEQARGPIENPAELGHDLESVVSLLATLPEYVDAFDALYADGITAYNLTDAIAYYETMNFTGLPSPFLSQFGEDKEPLSRQVLRGQQRFLEVGCASCHNGINLGGNSYQPLGVAEPWYSASRPADSADDGLYARTGREQDRHVFKVPTLHNVATTGPWLHDGSVTSLQQAVDGMARHELGRYLENEDIDDIVAFLRSLGDSLGMMGNCSASGSYTITMECSVTREGADESRFSSRTRLPATGEIAQRHHSDYTDALQRTAEGPDRIAAEMARIRSGEVAHFDFVQYEHIEMQRNARALSFPPANTGAEQRAALLQSATQWQQAAADYELVIADFLRQQAVVSSAKANLQDLLRILSRDADEKTLSALARTEERALTYYEEPGSATGKALESAARSLYDLSLDPERLDELTLQVRLLLANLDAPQA